MKFGEKQTLLLARKVEFGAYLAESLEGRGERVLLPAKQVPADAKVGDALEVFLYKDSKDRPIATVRTPYLTMGQVALLKVVQVGKIGAFLDWGLEKDLFLPYSEQKRRVRVGEEVLVSLYLDKSERLCATMNVYRALENESPYKKDDMVTGRVYEISERFGAFVAVDNRYSALIPVKELYGKVEIGTDISARVTKVLEDGRLVLGIRQKAHVQMEEDAKALRALLDAYAGVLPITDKASPDVILHISGMSKNQFKRAVGHLLKNGEIEITQRGIRRVNDSKT